jgi:DNA helicase-2/ATP-dependent DNA helicase PcrA
MPSRFLKEIPSNLVITLGVADDDDVPQVDLTADRWQVRQDARRNLYTGKALNSVENVQQFFKERGVNVPMRQAPASPPLPQPPRASLVPPVQSRAKLPQAPPPPKHPARTGTVVEHPRYGTGTIVRREGEGEDAKIVVVFQRHGMKKLVEKYAGLKKA